jgi:predicted nucleotidyltransferase
MLEKKYKPVLLNIILKRIPNCDVYLFGSRAKRKNKSGSDFDLAIDAGQKINRSILFKIQDDIEESSIPVFVDLVDVHDVDTSFLKHIKKEWILWKM